jgi:hypothetical protein
VRASVLALASTLAVTAVGAAAAYREGPPPGHTGAFGEPDCAACHFDADRADTAGSLEVRGPPVYAPGARETLDVVLRHPSLAAGGFQLTARFLEGTRAGEQAGSLAAATVRTRIQTDDRGVQYASHSEAGAGPTGHGTARWTLRWVTPGDGGPVAIDVAAQVANDDDSEFGERLYRARVILAPDRRSSLDR